MVGALPRPLVERPEQEGVEVVDEACAGAGLVNHLHPFLLWTLYKGAWQSTNQDTTLKPLVCSG